MMNKLINSFQTNDSLLLKNPFDNSLALYYKNQQNEKIGTFTIMKSKNTGSFFVQTEKFLLNEFDFTSEINEVNSLMTLKHEYIFTPFEYSTQIQKTPCANFYKLRTYYPMFKSDLKTHLHEISKSQSFDYFSGENLEFQNFLIKLFSQLTKSCVFLQDNSIFEVEISPDLIFLFKNGDFGLFVKNTKSMGIKKFKQKLLENLIKGNSVYLSPEIFENLRTENIALINNSRSTVFCLSLLILEIGLNFSIQEIFGSQGKLNRLILTGFLEEFENKFRKNNLLVNLVKKSVDLNEKNRPDLKELLDLIDRSEEVQNRSHFEILKNKPIKENSQTDSNKFNKHENESNINNSCLEKLINKNSGIDFFFPISKINLKAENPALENLDNKAKSNLKFTFAPDAALPSIQEKTFGDYFDNNFQEKGSSNFEINSSLNRGKIPQKAEYIKSDTPFFYQDNQDSINKNQKREYCYVTNKQTGRLSQNQLMPSKITTQTHDLQYRNTFPFTNDHVKNYGSSLNQQHLPTHTENIRFTYPQNNNNSPKTTPTFEKTQVQSSGLSNVPEFTFLGKIDSQKSPIRNRIYSQKPGLIFSESKKPVKTTGSDTPTGNSRVINNEVYKEMLHTDEVIHQNGVRFLQRRYFHVKCEKQGQNADKPANNSLNIRRDNYGGGDYQARSFDLPNTDKGTTALRNNVKRIGR